MKKKRDRKKRKEEKGTKNRTEVLVFWAACNFGKRQGDSAPLFHGGDHSLPSPPSLPPPLPKSPNPKVN